MNASLSSGGSQTGPPSAARRPIATSSSALSASPDTNWADISSRKPRRAAGRGSDVVTRPSVGSGHDAGVIGT